MTKAKKARRLIDEYSFPGFRPLTGLVGVFGDCKARIVRLRRRGKKRSAAAVVESTSLGTTARRGGCAICPAVMRGSIWNWRYVGSNARRVAR
jgi:hypothetical protein